MRDIKQVLKEYCAECKRKYHPECKFASQHPDKNLCMALTYVADGYFLAMREILQPQDIKRIIKIADDMMHEYSHDELVAMTEEKYYEEVLKRFNKYYENL